MAKYRFKPKGVPTLAVLLLLPLLISLGFWQLNRAHEKLTIQRAFLERGSAEPVALGNELLDPTQHHFRRAEAHGVFEPQFQILLDNRVHRGRAGYHVLTPLRVDGSNTRILVDRGWISWGDDRQRLPEIDTPTTRLRVTGRLIRPHDTYFTLQDDSALTGVGTVWQNLDLDRYRKLVGVPMQPLVLNLDAGDPQVGGFVREWPTYHDAWIDRHRGYAFQWFSLAAALVIIYIVVNIRRRDEMHAK
jgi:surfeit locus 1 family protein